MRLILTLIILIFIIDLVEKNQSQNIKGSINNLKK